MKRLIIRLAEHWELWEFHNYGSRHDFSEEKRPFAFYDTR